MPSTIEGARRTAGTFHVHTQRTSVHFGADQDRSLEEARS